METSLRTSDFRCFDPRLAEILPGREVEAAHFAAAAYASGTCDGIFVNGPHVSDWQFLEIIANLPRYVFNNPSKTLAKGFSRLSKATSLKLVSHDFAVDLDQTPNLIDLCLQWHRGTNGLSTLRHLRTLDLTQAGPSAKSIPLFPPGLTYLDLAYYSLESLQFIEPLDQLETLIVFSARQLESLPALKSLYRFSLSHACSSFSYASIPSSVQVLELTDCPDISDWSKLGHLMLRSLHVASTKAPKAPFPHFIDSGSNNSFKPNPLRGSA